MILKQMKIEEWKSILIAAVLAFNPIIMTHLTNLYLDGVLAISLFLISINYNTNYILFMHKKRCPHITYEHLLL